MEFYEKVKKVISNPFLIIPYIASKNDFKWVPEKIYIKLLYRARVGKRLNIDDPKTFNEKLQWLKLNDRKPHYTKLVDKFEVREYISEKIGEKYLIPLIGIWDNFDDIEFSELPNEFVLKCTHDSGSVFICTNKSNFNIEKVKLRINKALKRNYYYHTREWPYKNVKPRIVCESYIADADIAPDDYKVICFNGKAKLVQLHTDRHENHKQDFYDLNWNKTTISQGMPCSDKVHKKPKQFEEMIKLSERLASNTYQVRIDWFIVRDRLYFGEITFFDGSGFIPFDKEEDDYLLGSWIKIPGKNSE
ncbi:ATP-grasp fold amidoligase family protein [Sporosarcina thermotolerans]|uniref:ATP-grasp fold amidoligase family protein n=1 Tax=Sporosarcina thermotolerans TaxID=633404 RepID=A0AAW9A9J0_9BACL|nr:ATP-grasp fold amidoligase family protein [Sporosarcina thermotolerans]MDW0116301.1 ATP-grasp fold amidoligase family protein [Sporosarcina thermotolerans]WHT48269.1 ATP-grasp fold amidoligase family protein [Sporosarcina thermotolerans]